MKGDQLLLSAAAVGGRDGSATAITARTIARDFARAIEACNATEVDLSQINVQVIVRWGDDDDRDLEMGSPPTHC